MGRDWKKQIDIDMNVTSVRCILEPGDVTRYDIWISQTEFQKSVGEVTIALVDLGRTGTGFTFSTHDIVAAYNKMKGSDDLEAHFALVGFVLDCVMDHLPKEQKNEYTARALIEAAGYCLSNEIRGLRE